MAWRQITQSDLDMTDRELAAVASKTAGVLAAVTSEVRNRISTWRANRLSSDDSLLPDSFIARAAVIARWRLLAGLPGYEPSEARRVEYNNAESFFKDVASGRMRPEEPDDPVENTVPQETPGHGADSWSAGSRTGRARMDGL